MSIFENKEKAIGERMDALKLSRKFEAKKIAPQTVHLTRREEADRKEAWREYELGQLQAKIVLATLDHPPKGWDDDLRSPDYLPPPGDAWPPTGRTPDGKLILFPDKKRADQTNRAGANMNKATHLLFLRYQTLICSIETDKTRREGLVSSVTMTTRITHILA